MRGIPNLAMQLIVMHTTRIEDMDNNMGSPTATGLRRGKWAEHEHSVKLLMKAQVEIAMTWGSEDEVFGGAPPRKVGVRSLLAGFMQRLAPCTRWISSGLCVTAWKLRSHLLFRCCLTHRLPWKILPLDEDSFLTPVSRETEWNFGGTRQWLTPRPTSTELPVEVVHGPVTQTTVSLWFHVEFLSHNDFRWCSLRQRTWSSNSLPTSWCWLWRSQTTRAVAPRSLMTTKSLVCAVNLQMPIVGTALRQPESARAKDVVFLETVRRWATPPQQEAANTAGMNKIRARKPRWLVPLCMPNLSHFGLAGVHRANKRTNMAPGGGRRSREEGSALSERPSSLPQEPPGVASGGLQATKATGDLKQTEHQQPPRQEDNSSQRQNKPDIDRRQNLEQSLPSVCGSDPRH